MSAICGLYYRERKAVQPELGAAMMWELDICQSDAERVWQEGRVFFGCKSQHITPESREEILPYHDGVTGLVITADAIIDNRIELYGKLGISESSEQRRMSDSQLILMAYREWGEDCPKYLFGDFAFAIWDEKRQELFCAVDHTGTRTLYYYCSAELFAFSTLIRPLFELPKITKKYNDTWMADFLAMPCVMHQLDPEITIYQDIYLLPAGHKMMIRPQGIQKQVYWRVERQPELRLKSDGEYEEAFRAVLNEAVRCRLRSIRPVGVMMSGGLDSTSVACLAARELDKRGQRLSAFSALPMIGYRDWLPAGKLADETSYIETVRKYSGNIDVTYCRSENKHSLSETNRLFAMLEQPYKIFENMFWLESIMACAQERNIGVIINGFSGNATISWGDILPYLLSLFRNGRWYRLLRESWAVAACQHRPLRALFGLINTLLPYDLQNKLYRFRNRDWYLRDISPINPNFAQCMAIEERFRRFRYDPLFINRLDALEIRLKMLSTEVFSHRGIINTKQTLAYGIALRDPTMDKRVIDFCLSVPVGQFVRDGKNRLLIRRAMKGVLPDKVRLNWTERGRQSADWTQRLQPCWPELKAELRSIGALQAERKYLDLDKIQGELAGMDKLNDDAAYNSNLRMLIRSLIFSRFLKFEAGMRG